MADENRIVFPDEVEAIKQKAAQKEVEEKKEVSNEIPPEITSRVEMRNMITVPSNCPPGYEMGADGVCREVF